MFFDRVVLTSFVHFDLFLPCKFWRLTSGCQYLGGLTLGYVVFPLFVVFVVDLLLFFLHLQKAAVDMRANISGSLPIGTLT